MPIIFVPSTTNPEKRLETLDSSFAEKRQQATREYIANKYNQTNQGNSPGVLKPKYLENESVFYKNSSYIKDLLGEGN